MVEQENTMLPEAETPPGTGASCVSENPAETIGLLRRAGQIEKDGKAVYRLKTLIRLLSIIILTVVFLLLVIYGATIIANYQESYPVTVGSEEKSISLCESLDMQTPSSHLSMPVTEKLGDLSAYSIPDNVDSEEGGSHNGDGYLAYTFFIRNNIEGDLNISEKISIVSVSKNADKALRIRVYRNGEAATYAALSAVGTPEYGTEPFVSDTQAVDANTTLSEGEVMRYTIVVWLEGDDPECVNEICGGKLRLSIAFTTSRS